MRRRTVWLCVLPAVLAAGSVLPQGRLGDDFEPKLVSIVEGVYAYEGPLPLAGEDEIVRTNSLVVLTEDSVVIADGQDNVEEAARMVAAIREVTDLPIRYLINASPHGDHVNGNAVFEGATIIAHEKAKEVMVEAGVSRLPDITYQDTMTLHVGGRDFELYHFGPAHTPGDTIVLLPEERVAFLSEVYFNGVFTSLVDGFAVSHMKVLDEAMALEADWFVPGHGTIDGQSAEELRAGLEFYADNVRAVHDAVARHVAAGDSLEATMEAIDDELGEFTEVPFYRALKQRSVESTYRALSEVP